MGGIFGLISSTRPVAPIIRAGLERLVHRGGIDGTGIVTLDNNEFIVRKDAVRVDQLMDKSSIDDMPGYIGLGHVRSATHGRPVYENTHPFIDCTGNLALVMDGVISNYYELRKELEDTHSFSSRTDAELIVHLIENELNAGKDMIGALQSLQSISGYYTISLINRTEKKIYALSMGNPLIIAINDTEKFISSEEQALPMDQLQLYSLSTGQIAVLGMDELQFVNASNLSKVELKPHKAIITNTELNKGSFRHFMLKEIYDIPESLARAVNALQEEYLNDAWLLISKAHNIMLLGGSGTSYHSALIGKYYLSTLARLHSESVPAGEFLYEEINDVEPGTLIIAISQSGGESADIIRSIRAAKRRGRGDTWHS